MSHARMLQCLPLLLLALAFAPNDVGALTTDIREELLSDADRAKAISIGLKLAQDAEIAARNVDGTFKGKAGLLLAEGDSWFNYPSTSVIHQLQWRFDYHVVSVAHFGDTLESISYEPYQLGDLSTRMKMLSDLGQKPKAVLISGGGNDLAGEELGMLVNHLLSGLDAIDQVILKEFIWKRMQVTLTTYVTAVSSLNNKWFKDKSIPIIVHGYGDPIPDGRGFGGFRNNWILPGPWLQPIFSRKGYPRDHLPQSTAVMKQIVSEFNSMVKTVAESFPDVCYVDVRGEMDGNRLNLNQGETYYWGNELHPTSQGFFNVAKKFDEAIRTRCSGKVK